jgi:hypothetical protein
MLCLYLSAQSTYYFVSKYIGRKLCLVPNYTSIQQQQSFQSQASWGRLEMKPIGAKERQKRRGEKGEGQ